MTHIVYEVVKHAEGWAYRVGETLSETFPNHDAARRAAIEAAREHEKFGDSVGISYEDSDGHWHDELADGSDRPSTRVQY